MAHGVPDWGHARQITSFSVVDDLAELAARLGSVHVHDRRGDVLWMEDFSQDIEAWYSYTEGTGAAVALSTTYPKWPPNSVKLTGGSSTGGNVYIAYRMGLPSLKRLGLEASIAFFTPFDVFYFMLEHEDGTEVTRARVRISDTADNLTYEDSGGTYVELAELDRLDHEQGAYHTLKVVADFEEGEYMRVLFDDQSFDLSGNALRTLSQTGIPMLTLWFLFFSRSGENDYCQIDGAILTQDEP